MITKPYFTLAAMLAAAALLSACELRRDGETDDAATDEPVQAADPAPIASTQATQANSIIRDDLTSGTAPAEEEVEPISVTIPFPDGSDVSGRAERMLADILSSDALEEDWPVILGGHTDSAGNDEANLRASRSRAEAVAAWLVERGVDDDRIEIVAFGEQNPIEPNALPDGSPNPEGRRANRRVTIDIGPEEDSEDTAPETLRETSTGSRTGRSD